MTRARRLLRRRSAFAVAASLAMTAVPLSGFARAGTGTVTAASPPFVPNTSPSARLTFRTSEAPTSPASLLRVVLTGPTGATISDDEADEVDAAESTVSATFDLRGSSPGLYAVRVTDVGGGSVDDFTCASCLRVLANPPAVVSVSPATRGAGAGSGQTFTVTGSNFFDGVAVRFLRSGALDPAISYPSVGELTVGSDQRTVSGPITVAAGAVPGPRDVVVTNTDEQSVACAGCLTITPAPSFVSLAPAIAGQGAVARELTLTGANLQPGVTAAFFRGGSTTDAGGVTVTGVTVDSATRATVTVSVADQSATVDETRDLVLTNPDGGTARFANVLTIAPEPTVTGLSPSTLDGGATREDVTVTGTNLSPRSGRAPVFQFSGAGVTVHGYVPDASTPSTKGVLDVTIAPGAGTGGRTVNVVDPDDGGRATSGTVLTVGATPAVTSVSPPSLGRGTIGRQVTISGANFDSTNGGTNVAVTVAGVTLSGVVATSTTTITATASVPDTADVGLRDVSVLNTAPARRGAATCSGCFSVDSFAVDAISPSAALNSATHRLEITGSGLTPGGSTTATLTRSISRAGQGPIPFEGTVDANGTRFVGDANLRDMAPGAYTVRLGDDTGMGTCDCTFYLVAAADPTVSQVTPPTVPQGVVGRVLTITGTNFTRGTDVTFGTGVVKVGPVTFVDNTRLTVPVAVDESAPLGSVAVTALVPGFGADTQAQCASCLAVTKRPAVAQLSTATRGQGAPGATVTITGTDFQSGATASVGGDGVTVTGATVTNTTTMTASIAVAADAPPGARLVTVTNPDGGVGTCTCFTVTAKPEAGSITPASAGRGRSGIGVTLTGTGFQSGTTLSLGADVGVTNVVRTGDTITATLDLTRANAGPHPVSTANPDGGAGACSCTFTVNLVPTVTGIQPSSRGAGASDQTVTISGTDFGPAAVPSFADPGIGVAGVDVVDSSTIRAVISVAADAAPGARNLTVTVTDADTGESGTCAACFAVNPRPTITPTNAAAQRNRSGVTLTMTGTNFTAGAVAADLGEGITVTKTEATSPSSVTVTFDVGSAASLGARDLTVVNGDGGRATCADCLTVTTPRVFAIAGVPAYPVSGQPFAVTLTAHVDSDPGSAVDTSYAGRPVLSAAGDGHFAGGACEPASDGVSTCAGVAFGDLGDAELNASGTGSDADLGGTRHATVQPVGLTFTPTPPSLVSAGSPVTLTFRPVAGVAGASISDYAASRTAIVDRGGGRTESHPLSCSSATCSFTTTFSSYGRKAVRVFDTSTPSRSTPRQVLVVRTPTVIRDFRAPVGVTAAGRTITIRGFLRDTSGNPVSGVPMRIYTRTQPDTRWRGWRMVYTDSRGFFSAPARMVRTTTFQARFLPGSRPYEQADSALVTVHVRTRVVVASPANDARLTAGRPFTVRGSTYPAKPRVPAYLYWRRPDGRVVELARTSIASDGRFALTRTLGRGAYLLYVKVAGAAGNLSGYSPTFTVRVV